MATNAPRRRGGTNEPAIDDEREAVAFPGQGVDPVDLARVLHAHEDHELVGRLASLLGTTDWDDLDVDDTRIAQPSVFTASVVEATTSDAGLDAAACSLTFGHSLGELSAFTFAGVFDPGAGLDLVARRAELCHDANARRPGRMIVVMRLTRPEVEWVRRTVVARAAGVLELAVENGTGQFVLSGDVEATAVALELVAEAGGVARPLPIGGGYHSPLMATVVEPFAEAVAAVARHDPRLPVVSCTTQAVITSRDDVAAALSRALVLPVRWVDTLEAVRAEGVTRAVDTGPGETLTNLARFSPTLEFRSLRTPAA